MVRAMVDWSWSRNGFFWAVRQPLLPKRCLGLVGAGNKGGVAPGTIRTAEEWRAHACPESAKVLVRAATVPLMLTSGDRAPAFTLLDQNSEKVKLSGFRGRKVLVYFYPKADTPGCTTQACELRDIRDDVDVQIVGISPDAPEKQKKFDVKHSLGFPLLSDPDHAVADQYGAWGEKSMYGKKYLGIIRSAFLIDEDGAVAEAWPKISPKETPKKLLQALQLRRP